VAKRDTRSGKAHWQHLIVASERISPEALAA